MIWGEHGGIINSLVNASRVVDQSEWIPEDECRGSWLLQQNRPVNPKHWSAWDGSFSKADFWRNMKEFMNSLFCNDVHGGMRWGFKEIRYCNVQFVNFMSRLYPEASFIILLRDPIDSCVSFTSALAPVECKKPESFIATMTNVAKNQIKPGFEFFGTLWAEKPKNAKFVFFEELVRDPHGTLDEISGFLELSVGFDFKKISIMMKHDNVSERKRINSNLHDALKRLALPLLCEESSFYTRISGR